MKSKKSLLNHASVGVAAFAVASTVAVVAQGATANAAEDTSHFADQLKGIDTAFANGLEDKFGGKEVEGPKQEEGSAKKDEDSESQELETEVP